MRTDEPIDLRWIAAATAVVLCIVAGAVLLFKLLDILLLLFLGIILAAALQPWHTRLCRWGVPKGLAVLVIYSSFLLVLVGLSVMLLPVLLEQVTTVVGELPATYQNLRTNLVASQSSLMRLVGQRLPPFERATTALAATPELYQGVLGATAGVFGLLSYCVLLLAVGFYWTMEVPRLERVFLSWMPVARRTTTLNAWREIEFKLGSFVRGQGLVMLAVGLGAGISYAAIGLPNALALGVIAGLCEAVPLIGPLVGAAPALLVALPLGPHMVMLVLGIMVVLQSIENYVISPIIMREAVGVSALIGLFAILAFGTLYGLVGVLIAIPMAAVGQVLLESFAEPAPPSPAAREPDTLDELRRRLQAVRQQARGRLRTRSSRMGIDPDLADHVVDAVDQRIEEAAERIDTLIAAAQAQPEAPPSAAIVEEWRVAIADIETAVGRIDNLVMTSEGVEAPAQPTEALPLAALTEAADEVQQVVDRVEALVLEEEQSLAAAARRTQA
jgi:predicted PurR-regulated permease PerM